MCSRGVVNFVLKFSTTIFFNHSSFIRCERCELFCFSCNLSAFASRFQHSRIRILRNFFSSKEVTAPESDGACTPMLYSLLDNETLIRQYGLLHVAIVCFNIFGSLYGVVKIQHTVVKKKLKINIFACRPNKLGH